ncbi:hypothetical protein [Paenibacillus sp. FSL H7-0326]|uniref:hypothetical protein n=1 Tax=Paenibacillus sp. FSL H7-0326 TaxID=1921144 RepID=UPI00117F68A1|nr:hypothetical protein [Paenibacillus sp. FSL H7-0326]
MAQKETVVGFEQTIGDRDIPEDERLWEAFKELVGSYTTDGRGAGERALQEFPDTPQTVAELFSEVAKMYRGETPFTYPIFLSLQYYSEEEPLKSELSTLGSLPIPPEFYMPDNESTKLKEISNSYNTFNEYVDKYISLKFK